MLLHDIQAASVEARKAKDQERAALLVTLYAEAQRLGKDDGNRDSTDEEVVRTVKKFLKGVDDFIAVTKDDAKLHQLRREKAVREVFLPKQADEATLREVISRLVAGSLVKGPKAMGPVMAALKSQLPGNYDGALASRLVKEAVAAG